MSKVPMGKVLLRNVIRHTDAHNKIQEESEMWKMRDWEKQTSYQKSMPATEFMRGSMHCDRVSNNSREHIPSKDRTSGHDDREARYWSRKLYEFEANDPDRWGHSGFKELYPEEFKSDSEEDGGIKNNGHHKVKKCGLGTEVSKRSKKSSRKKKKKKSKKEEKRRRVEGSSSDGSSDESNDTKCKKRRKGTKSKHKNKKRKTRGREEDSNSEESDDEGDGDRRTHSHKKRKRDSHKGTDSGVDSQKKKRKNWKAPNEENSDDSSGD